MSSKKTITLEEYESMTGDLEDNGFCTNCGEFQFGGCEPDARKYKCEACDQNTVYGLEECLMMGLVS